MSNRIWEQSIRQFVADAASAKPTPGGGSVAALVAALGASMTAMVGNLSQGEKFAAYEPEITAAIQGMYSLIQESEKLLAKDIACFNAYMNILQLKCYSAEEKLARKQALQEATIQALLVPLHLIEACKDGLQLTSSITAQANRNVISDLGIGAILLEAAAQSALLTVEINIQALKDNALKDQYALQAFSLMQEISALKHNVIQAARQRIIAN